MPRWAFQTKSGLPEIVPLRVDQFALLFDGEPLENHATAAAAAEAISNGICSWPSVGGRRCSWPARHWTQGTALKVRRFELLLPSPSYDPAGPLKEDRSA